MHSDPLFGLLSDLFGPALWIEALGHSEDSKRLATCIAMDVFCEALDAKVFADIFEEIDDYEGDIQRRFGEIITQRRSMYGVSM